MASRRRIDWSVLPEADRTSPVWTDRPAPSEAVTFLHRLNELFELEDAEGILKRAVELSLELVGLVRAGIYLYDEPADLMLGSWGTDMDRRVVDEHHAMFELGKDGRHAFTKAISGEAHWTVIENCPIIDLRDQATQVIGIGWVVATPIHLGDRRLGMLFNDAGLTDAAIDADKQARAAILCAQIALALQYRHHSNQFSNLPSITARHPVLRKAVHRLTHDPSLGGDALARELSISVSHLARLFKSEMGVTLVDYRNQLRLERFAAQMDAGCTNLLDAALAAGFGSYSQFHRVFRTLRGRSPRDYFASRGIRLSRRS